MVGDPNSTMIAMVDPVPSMPRSYSGPRSYARRSWSGVAQIGSDWHVSAVGAEKSGGTRGKRGGRVAGHAVGEGRVRRQRSPAPRAAPPERRPLAAARADLDPAGDRHPARRHPVAALAVPHGGDPARVARRGDAGGRGPRPDRDHGAAPTAARVL